MDRIKARVNKGRLKHAEGAVARAVYRLREAEGELSEWQRMVIERREVLDQARRDLLAEERSQRSQSDAVTQEEVKL